MLDPSLKKEVKQYLHRMLAATTVGPGHATVLQPPREFMAARNGGARQDSEHKTAYPWLDRVRAQLAAWRPVTLGDARYAGQGCYFLLYVSVISAFCSGLCRCGFPLWSCENVTRLCFQSRRNFQATKGGYPALAAMQPSAMIVADTSKSVPVRAV